VCGPGVPINEIGRAIHAVADAHKYGVVKCFVGHGVGTIFHSWPHVAHHRNREPGVMQRGMTFTIEPMFTAGRTQERYWADEWTAVTVDGSLSAQWEHTLLVTDNGVDILTAYE
jgi:methionyl aminopeptidase